MVQSTLAAIPNAQLKAYIVWEPIRSWDSMASARSSQALVRDPRARQFWAHGLDLAVRTQNAIDLKGEPAWDVYLLYDANANWEADAVPKPADYMHQLGGRLPDDKLLDPDSLTARVSRIAESTRGR